jgi:CheY-like chemotaxis protein
MHKPKAWRGTPDIAHDLTVLTDPNQLNNPERDRTKGMGLGLSIVQRLCRLLDIGLELQSAPKQGTRFELTLPLHAQQVSVQEHACREVLMRPLDMLIADFRLRGQETGIQVIRALREHQPDLRAAIISGDIGSAQLQAIELTGLQLLHKPVRLETLMALLQPPSKQ